MANTLLNQSFTSAQKMEQKLILDEFGPEKSDSDGLESYIEFYNVGKGYQDLKALDNVSFSINQGEIFGYIGPNGAGKTTTIKILVGLIQKYDGSVKILGKDVKHFRQEIEKIIGYLPQEAGFQTWRTIDHVLTTFGKLSGLSGELLESRIQKVLGLVGLIDVRNKKVIHLSGGMVQKLRLAQALLHNPKILVLDEPMNGLDPTSRYQMKGIILGLAKRGITIFFSSHILSDVQDIAHKIGILNRGQMMIVGSPEELQNQFQIGNVIEIEFAHDSPECDAISQISSIESMQRLENGRRLLQLVSGVDIDETIHLLLGHYYKNKCAVRKLQLQKPSLEDVYLHYVGEGK